jgi:predicted RNase H-like nuclease (RuvC/YqgF family)
MENQNENHTLESETKMFEEAVDCLTKGLINIYEPGLSQVEKMLKELTEKESMLLDQIHNENLNLSETQHSNDLTEMFNRIEVYQAKLTNIKKEMKNLHDKSVKLKKRALKIQQFKEKQEYIKQQKEAELKTEQDLIPKTSSS